ncbi:peptide-methionine (S)-S-oxide reductase MsrA [Pedobacter sp. HMF7647]|uniref:Peptide methionine sulfoxide reductase MsrA n=1 Tax=Hufsiella arboris TaxID=2695275 RepID=A0A7K1Y5J4_9SPHI|nr:peptide-methionine (S)-S-oxide reductase MsrA [Hufsiella arboris]MXV49847.1 peptide-methionine (S)-S-oxide reductase MsrA [Hufsiella arboris]
MKTMIQWASALILMISVSSCNGQSKTESVKLKAPAKKAMAAFAEGCFWCSEHIYESIPGVDSVVSGYAGGDVEHPSYEQVSSETTGHAETILVYYDPAKVSYSQLLKAFFASHDPTTLNRQGPDEGTSYRSVIFYSSPQEKLDAEQAVRDITLSGRFSKPIVTEILPLKKFWRAEDYHQDYEKNNPNNPYIQSVSKSRYEQFKKNYKGKIKDNE